MRSIYNFTLEELISEFEANKIPKFRAKQIFSWLYEKKANSFDEFKNVDKKTIAFLEENYLFNPFTTTEIQVSKDKTQKILFKLADGNLIESVLMPNKNGYSLCVTSQVGCALKCDFCASGVNGLVRSLTFDEVLLQYVNAQKIAGDEKITNIVIMGIGEPFDNYVEIKKFLETIIDEAKFNFASRKITVSTSGLLPKIIEFANDFPQINLAVSLHAVTNEKRSRIMPVNNKYNIEQLMQTLDEYQKISKRQITLEYLLINKLNDTVEDAQILANYALKLKALVNLIPYNNVPFNDYARSNQHATEKFLKVLEKAHVNVTLRREFGGDIDAACGQLRNNNTK